jgi:hypothetical protein
LDICYLNTDLDLMGPNDLGALAAALEGHGLLALHVGRGEDGLWRARFETVSQHKEPAGNIADLLAAVEALPAPTAIDWQACTLREFNIGYDCGRGPWAFNQVLCTPLLRRMANAGVALRITIYPAPGHEQESQPAAP